MKAAPIRIRAHHLLCMLGFRGLGYSPEFVENMTRIRGILSAHPETLVRIMACCDDICRSCPHETDLLCSKSDGAEQEVADKDRRVLEIIGLGENASLSVSAAYEKIGELLTPQDLSADLCRNCEWLDLGYCVEGLTALREGS
ncbi:MAG: DUF1284 domain-containing protein [Planctomycetota bacterium]